MAQLNRYSGQLIRSGAFKHLFVMVGNFINTLFPAASNALRTFAYNEAHNSQVQHLDIEPIIGLERIYVTVLAGHIKITYS